MNKNNQSTIYLDEPSIIKHVYYSYFSRGKAYFQQKAVEKFSVQGNQISGLVKGSRVKPYKTVVNLGVKGIEDSNCSCPLMGECKHVAALALAFLHKYGGQAKVFRGFPEESKSWHQALQSIIKENNVYNQLAIILQFKKSYYHSDSQNEDRWELQLRPIVYRESPEKEECKIDWSDGMRDLNRYSYGLWNTNKDTLTNISPDQYVFFQLLARALKGNDYYGNKKFAAITQENALHVWTVLEEHQRFNVSLLSGQKGQNEVKINARPLEFAVVLTDGQKDSLELRGLIYHDGHSSDLKPVFFGDPPVFALVVLDPKLGAANHYFFELYSVTFPKKMKTLPQDFHLTVPSKDAAIFNNKYLPDLLKQCSILNKSKKIKLPKKIMPKGLIKIQSAGKNSLKISTKVKYGQNITSFFTDQKVLDSKDGSLILRDDEGELKLQQQIQKLIEEEASSTIDKISKVRFEGLAAAQFMTKVLPKLKTNPNIDISVAKDLPNFQFDISEPKIEFSVDENDGNDWFDLNINIKVGGESVNFRDLFAAIAHQEEFFLMPSGRYFPLDHQSFSQLRQLIVEAGNLRESEKGTLALSPFQVDFFTELEQLGIVSHQAERWQKLIENLKNSRGAKLQKPPPGLLAELRPYQQIGYSWLKFLHQMELGGVLADDMGLGKTVQTLALIVSIGEFKKNSKPFLVIAPTSVVENWDLELERFAPHLKKAIMRQGDRSALYANIESFDIIVTSYSLFQRDFEKLKKLKFDTLILDEAQFIKNHQTKAYSLIRKINSSCKIALTGTPMENNLMELWSIFSVVAPGLFPPPKKFKEIYQIPIEKGQNKEALAKLRSRIKPFIMRRKKEVVEKELPKKIEQTLLLEMTNDQRHIYDLHLQKERQRVLGLLNEGGLQANRFAIFQSLTKMRQLCLHPALVDRKHADLSSIKLKSLIEQVNDLIAEDHRVLIFSQFTSFLALVKKTLDKNSVPYLYLAGETKNRGQLVKQFQESKIPIFLISIKAGGFGLNLTAADYCILLDPWWNPAVENQAIDRTHRIGQKRPVFVYRLIVKNTIEEKVVALQNKKRKLFSNVLEDGEVFSTLVTEADIKKIFE